MPNILSKKDITLINRETVKRHGGSFVSPFNILNENPLAYLIEAVEAEMFGEPLYPKIYNKAGVYMFNIITNHIFQDGNKRTGLGAALYFLEINKPHFTRGSGIVYENINEILHDFTIEVASGKVTLEECQAWFKENIQQI